MTSATTQREVYVLANGLRHHLLARGDPGQPVVMMIHGLGGQAHVFDGSAARLAEHFHVYSLDVRGRGESEWGPADGYHLDNYVEDLEQVREGLGIERMAIVGTSMGGLIGMHYGAKFGDRLSRLVLNDIGPQIEASGIARISGYIGGAPEGFPEMKSVVQYFRDNYGPMGLSEDEMGDMARWSVRKNDSGIYVWKMDPAVRKMAGRPSAMAAWDAWAALTCPVLIVRGAESDILSKATVKRMAEVHPGTTVVEVAGRGHAPTLNEPEARKAISEFLGQGSDG